MTAYTDFANSINRQLGIKAYKPKRKSRKIKIFGRAVSVNVLLILLIFGVALAAFALSFNFDTSVTVGSGPGGSMELVDCTKTAGEGTMNCSYAAPAFDIDLLLINDDFVGVLNANLQRTTTENLIMSFDDGTPDPGMTVTCEVNFDADPYEPCQGYAMNGSGQFHVRITIDGSGLTAGQVVADFSPSISME